jgi:rSAM/selenodomain-associated transferase 2
MTKRRPFMLSLSKHSDGFFQPLAKARYAQRSAMNISVIVPVLNEEKSIAATLQALLPLAPYETIVVDGGSKDRTRKIAAELGVTLISSEPGRGRQMNRGAGEASGDVLLFLHADTRLPPSAFHDITDALNDPRCLGGRFDVELEGRHWLLPIVARMISYRSRVTKVGTGDQAIFVRREVFKKIGGFPDIPLMEDIALCRTLKRLGEIACLRSRVVTSARRWEVDGIWRTIFTMWMLKLLYLAGVSPSRLKQFYADTR